MPALQNLDNLLLFLRQREVAGGDQDSGQDAYKLGEL